MTPHTEDSSQHLLAFTVLTGHAIVEGYHWLCHWTWSLFSALWLLRLYPLPSHKCTVMELRFTYFKYAENYSNNFNRTYSLFCYLLFLDSDCTHIGVLALYIMFLIFASYVYMLINLNYNLNSFQIHLLVYKYSLQLYLLINLSIDFLKHIIAINYFLLVWVHFQILCYVHIFKLPFHFEKHISCRTYVFSLRKYGDI